MRVVVTGTPGTGKTTATRRLETRLGTGTDNQRTSVVHLNDAIREEGLFSSTDEARDSLVADIDAIERWLGDPDFEGVDLVESHLAHLVAADRVVVVRCHPDELGRRLTERGESEATVAENRESEALDVVLVEAVERHGRDSTYELDATDRTPDELAGEIEAVVAGERDPRVGVVSFADSLAECS